MDEFASTTIFEEHHSVLAHWFARKVSGATVVCFDAHLDLQPVSQRRLDRLKACRTADEVRSLGKRHHLLPDCDSAYSIEDFYFAAAKLGLVKHLVWVAPPHVKLEPADTAIEQFSELPGITLECLQGVQQHRIQNSPCLTADFWGLRVTVCRQHALPVLDLPSDSLIDIDIDYFVELPSECLGETPSSVMASLNASGLNPTRATLSRSVQSGFTPLRYRFLAEWMAALIKDPSGKSADGVTGQCLAEVYDLIRRQPTSVDQGHVDKLVKRIPFPCGAGAVEYALSQVWRLLAEPGQGNVAFSSNAAEFLQASIAMQQAYAMDPIRLASEFPNRQIPVSSDTVEHLEQLTTTLDASEGIGAEDWNAIGASSVGLLWCHLQQWNRAEACFARTTRSRNASCELALELARSFLQRGSPFGAMPYLQISMGDDRTRPQAILLMAIVSRQLGKTQDTRRLLEQLIEMTPAWSEPRRLWDELRS